MGNKPETLLKPLASFWRKQTKNQTAKLIASHTLCRDICYLRACGELGVMLVTGLQEDVSEGRHLSQPGEAR